MFGKNLGWSYRWSLKNRWGWRSGYRLNTLYGKALLRNWGDCRFLDVDQCWFLCGGLAWSKEKEEVMDFWDSLINTAVKLGYVEADIVSLFWESGREVCVNGWLYGLTEMSYCREIGNWGWASLGGPVLAAHFELFEKNWGTDFVQSVYVCVYHPQY